LPAGRTKIKTETEWNNTKSLKNLPNAKPIYSFLFSSFSLMQDRVFGEENKVFLWFFDLFSTSIRQILIYYFSVYIF